jgi:hypothetical protein
MLQLQASDINISGQNITVMESVVTNVVTWAPFTFPSPVRCCPQSHIAVRCSTLYSWPRNCVIPVVVRNTG